jgi:hypothetical protein
MTAVVNQNKPRQQWVNGQLIVVASLGCGVEMMENKGLEHRVQSRRRYFPRKTRKAEMTALSKYKYNRHDRQAPFWRCSQEPNSLKMADGGPKGPSYRSRPWQNR